MTPDTTPSPSEHQSGSPHQHTLACMEIWDSNESIESAISAPGIDAWVYSRPHEADLDGGDIHYVSMCGAGRIARFFIADVSGHGSHVAEIARTLRGVMRRNINTLDNTRFTRALNEEFQMENTGGKYATAILATYFTPTDELVLVNAGHPRPLHYDAVARSWSLLSDTSTTDASASNLPLGIIDPTDFSQFAVRLNKDDLVLLYTDGLMEAKAPDGAILGEEGLLRILRSINPDDRSNIIKALIREVERYQVGRPIDDDVTAILLHHTASDPPKQTITEQISVLAKSIGLIRS